MNLFLSDVRENLELRSNERTLTRSGGADSAAILEQLTGIRDATAQSLGLVEQLATASSALRGQGERLSHKIGQFRLG